MKLGPLWYVIGWSIWSFYKRDWLHLAVLAILGVISFPTLFWFNDLPAPTWSWCISAVGFGLLVGLFTHLIMRARRERRDQSK